MLNKVMNVVGTALNSVEKMTEYPYPIFELKSMVWISHPLWLHV